ncbi:hypothetical protein MDUV_46490 [Mycolicibacterium duvalii]|uniref:Uncharacterized protein n=1 Tax=Mycolicibacterium duvalii TaxID=39688 RepID=A0A7I7K892_9MYCO|nr:hypothetical protein MDUV_46490 [Mycolicibacterium duvalii]
MKYKTVIRLNHATTVHEPEADECESSRQRAWSDEDLRIRFRRRLLRNSSVAPFGTDEERDEEIRRIWRAASRSGR